LSRIAECTTIPFIGLDDNWIKHYENYMMPKSLVIGRAMKSHKYTKCHHYASPKNQQSL